MKITFSIKTAVWLLDGRFEVGRHIQEIGPCSGVMDQEQNSLDWSRTRATSYSKGHELPASRNHAISWPGARRRLPAQCYGTSSFTVGKYVAYRWESRVRIVIPSTAAWAPI